MKTQREIILEDALRRLESSAHWLLVEIRSNGLGAMTGLGTLEVSLENARDALKSPKKGGKRK